MASAVRIIPCADPHGRLAKPIEPDVDACNTLRGRFTEGSDIDG